MIFILTYFQKKSSLLIHFNLYLLKLTEANYLSRNVSREIKKKGGVKRVEKTNRSNFSVRPEILRIPGVEFNLDLESHRFRLTRACRLGQECRIGRLMRRYHTMWRDGPPPPLSSSAYQHRHHQTRLHSILYPVILSPSAHNFAL